MEINRLVKHINSIWLDSHYKGTSEQFLLHFKEQFRLLDDLVPLPDRMPAYQRKILLELAVQDMEYFRSIANTEEYQRVLKKHNVVDYEKYFDLLLLAAQQYD